MGRETTKKFTLGFIKDIKDIMQICDTKDFTLGFIKDIKDIMQICDKIGNDYVEIDMPIGDNGENVVVSIYFEKNHHLSDD